MKANRTDLDSKDFLFRILRRIRRYCKILFQPVSSPLTFLLIKHKVRREVRKNGLDRIDNVLQASNSAVLYSFASFADTDALEFGTQIGGTSAALAHDIKVNSKSLGSIFGCKKLHLFDSFVGLLDPFNNSVDSLNLFEAKGVRKKNTLKRINQKKLNNIFHTILPKNDYVIYSTNLDQCH